MKRTTSSQVVLGRGRLFRRIMVAVENEETAVKAVDLASGIAAQNGAELTVVSFLSLQLTFFPAPGGPMAILPQQTYDEFAEAATETGRTWVSRLERVAEAKGVRATSKVVVATESVAEEAAKLAKKDGIDLIVVGTKNPGILRRLFQGNLWGPIIDKVDCPVLVVQ